MTTYVALLRAVNVGGTGKLPMATLKAMCEALGLNNVRTYIASGNVVFDSPLSELQLKTQLEDRLAAYAGKPVGVMLRSGEEMASILAANPFPSAAPNRTVVIFLDGAPPLDLCADIRGRGTEDIASGAREIYVHYVDGIADSRLRIAAAASGTARNMNTVAKLAEWSTG